MTQINNRFANLNSIYSPVIPIIVLSIITYIFVRNSNITLGEEQCKNPIEINEVLGEIEKVNQENEELERIIETYLNNVEDSSQNATQKEIVEKMKHELQTLSFHFEHDHDTDNTDIKPSTEYEQLRRTTFSNLEDSSQNATQKEIVEKMKHELKTVTLSFRYGNGHDTHYTDVQPSTEYEQLRRGIRQNIPHMCNYYSFELDKINKKIGFNKEKNQELELIVEYKKILISDFDQMRLVDGYETWRQKEGNDLSDLVQRRLSYIQNPVDCKNAKKLYCEMEMHCGLGCQLHHIMHCLIASYATERTMVLNSKSWTYNAGGWEEIFKPVSQTCTEYNLTELENWPGSANSKLLFYPRIYLIRPRPPHLPLTLPDDLLPRIQKIHSDPSLWWISQFVKYLFKFKNETREEIVKKKLHGKKPIVGVHIRRTDKINVEATSHRVEEYMTYVEDYYLTLDMNNTKTERRVFLATDDPNVIKELHKKYPQYTIIDNIHVAEKSSVKTRYTDLNGILSDLLMLSLSDYLVCTFSSNVCRLAYEIMQNYHTDAYNRYKSLDYGYFYAGQRPHDHEAILAHKSRNIDEISINPGDLIHVYNNLWNGFSKGKNMRTLKVGLFPTFKVKDKIKTISLVKLPSYLNAD